MAAGALLVAVDTGARLFLPVVTERLLADVFGVDATVRDGPEIVPHRPL